MEVGVQTIDQQMMLRCISLARTARGLNEYPYAALVCRNGELIAETVNRVARDQDVFRHAEIIAITEAQKVLGRISLDDCTIYSNAEPCPLCAYAIRESRIGRVVFALRSPHMGGLTKWNILGDQGLAVTMPEVFAPPPTIVAGFMSSEADRAGREWNPVFWAFIKYRGLLQLGESSYPSATPSSRSSVLERVMMWLRRRVFDPMSGRPSRVTRDHR
jgi:tRNA(adenine34) deaminase